MITVMVLFVIAGSTLLFIPVLLGYKKHVETHHIDVMAGDEGED